MQQHAGSARGPRRCRWPRREVPRIGMPALCSAWDELQRRLPAILHDAAQHLAGFLFLADQGDHVLGGQRLEVQAVGGVVVGADRLRVAVDHDGLEAGIAQRVAGVHAAIVELDPLPDAVRPAAEDDDLLAARSGAIRSRACRSRPRRSSTCRACRRRIPPRRCRCACRPAARRARARCAKTSVSFTPADGGEAHVGEAERLQPAHRVRGLRQAVGADLGLGGDDLLDLAQEPGVELAGLVDLLERDARAHRLRGHQHAVGARRGERGVEGLRGAIAGHRHVIEAGQARSPARAAPSAAPPRRTARSPWSRRPTSCEVVSVAGVPGNFSKVKRGIFTTT